MKKVNCDMWGQGNRMGKILDVFFDEQLLVNAVIEERSPAH